MIDNLPFFYEKIIPSFLILLIDTLAETCFYTMSVYYMAAKVTKTRWTLSGALMATAAGIAASVVLAGMMRGV